MKKTENRFRLARTKYNKNGFQSVKTVSEQTNVSKSLIDDLESNAGPKRDVGYSKVCTLAEYYGVSADYLLGLTDFPSVDSDLQATYYNTGFSIDAINHIKSNMTDDGVQPGIDMLNELLTRDQFWDLVYSLDKLGRSVATVLFKVKTQKISFLDSDINVARVDYLDATDNFALLVNSLFNYKDIIDTARKMEELNTFVSASYTP